MLGIEGNVYSPEKGLPLVAVENQPKAPRHCLFAGGMSATNVGLTRLHNVWGEQYGGKENVSVFNSVVSSDKPDSKRVEKMAGVILAHAGTGLDIYAHSLGAVEVLRAIEWIEKHVEGFFDDPENTKNIRIELRGPVGVFQGIKERSNVVAKGFPRLVSRHVLRSRTLECGLDSFNAFPSREENALLPEQIRSALGSRWSNMTGELPVNPYVSEASNQNYLERFLTPDQLSDLDVLDGELSRAGMRNDGAAVRKYLRERGALTKPALGKIFEGALDDDNRDNPPPGFLPKILAKGALSALVRGGGNKPFKKFVELEEKGASVYWRVPEYDFLVSAKHALRFYESVSVDPANRVRVDESITHPADPVADPKRAIGGTVFQR
ncbi:MAG: hypothetical protein AAB553_06810 [Patescibacteria group bacterium]